MERLHERFRSFERIKNEDVDRAVTRSVLLASLFCLLDAPPLQTGGIGPWSHVRKQFKQWLPEAPFQGAISHGEESVIRAAIETCAKRLKDLEDRAFVSVEIDPLGLVLPERGGDWGGKLASRLWGTSGASERTCRTGLTSSSSSAGSPTSVWLSKRGSRPTHTGARALHNDADRDRV